MTDLSLHVCAGDLYAFIGHNGAGKTTTLKAVAGIQYLNLIADVFALSKDEREVRIAKYADAFELTPSLGDLISAYSHGMKQKLAIISALIQEPRLLILEEPFVGLDPKAALTLKKFMRELCQSGGAVFFSTHVLEVAERSRCSRQACPVHARADRNRAPLLQKQSSTAAKAVNSKPRTVRSVRGFLYRHLRVIFPVKVIIARDVSPTLFALLP